MKTRFIIFLSFGFISISTFGQFSDDSTIAIEQYFNGEYKPAEIESRLVSGESDRFLSEVTVIQSGQENNVYIRSLQAGDEQQIFQNGQKNNYEYYNYYSQENSSLQLNQEGNANSVQVFGENSLMKDAVINQKSDFNSIVIRNYTN
jgi:hypothetical protein